MVLMGGYVWLIRVLLFCCCGKLELELASFFFRIGRTKTMLAESGTPLVVIQIFL